MRAISGVLLVLLVGCGREIVDEFQQGQVAADGARSDGGVAAPLVPGWYDVPVDAVQRLGALELHPGDGRTVKATFVFSDSAPAGDFTVAVGWRRASQLQVLGTARRAAPEFEARLAPPASVVTERRCGGFASGVLFVLVDGAVVGASAGGWLSDFDITYDECGGVFRGGSLRLERDPGLEVARCRLQSKSCVDTSPVRVTSGSVVVEDSGVVLETELGLIDSQATLSIEVNGVVARRWSDWGSALPTGQMSALSRALFHDGKNRVTLRMGQRPPWEANVVLPPGQLSPRVAPALSLNKRFGISFEGAAWVTSSRVDLFPVDAPWTRAVYPSFSSRTSPIEGLFEGFPDGRGGRVTGTRASVQLSATRTDGAFTLLQQTSFETPITP
ncbi:MAG: hypothetical protein GQE15_23475 [Archangiaceae bacterium]|nr:hypothetical protein [Archangiaceae bacterium]